MARIKPLFIVFGMALFISQNAFSQTYWEPQTNITGYVSTEFNYFNNLDGYDINYGTSISEAGILVTYRPQSNFTLKSVFVYRPQFSFDQMLNEAYGELAVNDNLNVRVGRFLVPLSPMNSYYYAPVNTSATLPVLVSNHEFFPLNTDGVSINGSIGDDFKFKYDVFGGGFRNATYLPTGPVGFFGKEVSYFSTQLNDPIEIDESFNNTYNLGAGFKTGFSYKTYVDAGFSLFKQMDSIIPLGVNLPPNALYEGSPATYIVQEYDSKKLSYGFNATFKYNNTQLAGEFWKSELNVNNIDYDLKGSFVTLSHRINQVTPYVRFEKQVTTRVEYNRYTAGFNYKPSFSQTLKLEYMLYDHSTGNIGGVIAALIFSF